MRLWITLIVGLTASGIAAQQSPQLQRADSLLQHGALAAAEVAFTSHLAAHPDDVHALLGRATARAWSGQRELAMGDYAAVMAISSGHPEALVGIGYLHLWSGRYADGERFFTRLLSQDSTNVEALKGLAYSALWSGRLLEARVRFSDLTTAHPENADGFAGLAQALLASRQPDRARDASRRARELDPDREDVRSLERAARRAPSPVEVSFTAGQTTFDRAAVGDPHPIGLRSIDVAVHPSGDLTLLAQYDNGISVDTRALAVSGATVPTYRVAGVVAWGGRFITRVGGGIRTTPGANRQTLLEVDQVLVLGSVGLSGGWTGIATAGPWEHVGRLGISVAPNLAWEIATTGYLRAVRNGSDGVTGVLTVTRKFARPLDVTGGMAVGRAAEIGGRQTELFGHIVARIAGGHGASLTLRRQFGAAADPFTMIAAGFTLALGRR